MTPPISSPVSSNSFPSSTTSRGYDENNFHFQPKAWPTTASASPRKSAAGSNNAHHHHSPGGPLSIQTNPQTFPQQVQQQSWMATTSVESSPVAQIVSSPLPPRSLAPGIAKQQLQQTQQQQHHFATSPGRLNGTPGKTSVRELVEAANAASTSKSKDPRQALAPRGNLGGTALERPPQQPILRSASPAALESLEAVRRETDAWQPVPRTNSLVGRPAATTTMSTRSANSTPLRTRDAIIQSTDSTSLASAGGGRMDAWMTESNENGEPDDLEQALFEQRLTEDVYGVAVRKINQNGKSNLRYVKCNYVDAADLESDANGFSSSRSVSSNSARGSRFSRFGRDRSLERGEVLMKGKLVKVLTWGKKKEMHLPIDRFVCVRKGKTTERTKRNSCPAVRIVSLITDDPNCPSLDIEAPTRLDRDKFAKAFSRFLGVPLEGETTDARSIRSDSTPQSLKDPPGSTTSQQRQTNFFSSARQSFKSQHSVSDLMSGAKSNASNNSNHRRRFPLPAVNGDNKSSSHSRKGFAFAKNMFSSPSGRVSQQEAMERSNTTLDVPDPDPQMASLPSTHDSKDNFGVPKPVSSREPSILANQSQITAPSVSVMPKEDDASVVSSITGAAYDQELVEELHMALTDLRAELEESRAEAARAVKVAEQAIQSAENSNSKDWNSTVTHKAAEAAAQAQKRSAEALAKARMAEERLEQERKKAAIWRKQAETASEEAGQWQTRAAVAEVQRASMAEALESAKQRGTVGGGASPVLSNSGMTSELDRLRSKLALETATRRRLLNEVQDLRGNIRVYCRPRAAKGISAISTPSQEVLMLHRERASLKTTEANTTPLSFEFDGILGVDSTQHDVYEEMEAVCLSAMDGFNCCLMTYGQSGAGKTYTMLGKVEYSADGAGVVSISDYGIHLQAAQQFFTVLQHRKDRYLETVTFCIVEVSNERLVDMLVGTEIGESQGRAGGSRSSKSTRRRGDDAASASCSERPTKLEIKTDRDGETTVHGLLSVEVNTFDDILMIWKQCLSRRRQRLIEQGVDFEEHETSSHVIGTLKIQSKNISTGITTKGKIQFVDLAASNVVPRRTSSKKVTTPDSVVVSIGIGHDWKFSNRSLATLSEVITARSQFQRSVPYRNATITHLLSDSLEADTKVVLVACVSSDLRDLQETSCTLKFAQTVRKVVIGKATKHSNAHA